LRQPPNNQKERTVIEIELSIIVPALNEQDNVAPLVEQVEQAIIAPGIVAEMIVIDDGSTDATPARLRELMAKYSWLRVLRREKAMGQSAAMFAGIAASRGKYVGMLDADLQNDPADLPAMLQRLRNGEGDMVQGDRSANRRDTAVRRVTSWVGRTVRRLALGDTIRDTGCTARVVRIDIARQFPLQYKGMHRFLPAYAKLVGGKVIEQPVNHRPRHTGEAKYGILNRGPAAFFDTLAMRWMTRRLRDVRVKEVDRA